MAINTNIALTDTSPQFESPMNALAKVLQVKAAQQQQLRSNMEMEELQRSRAGENTLAQLLGAGKKPDEIATGLAQAGYGKQSMAYTKQQQDMAKDKAATEKAQLEMAMQKLSFGSQLLGAVTDQASYDRAKFTAQANGLDVSNFVPQYDPVFVEAKKKEGQTVKEQLEQKWKAMQYSTPDANAVLAAGSAGLARDQKADQWKKTYDQKDRELGGESVPLSAGAVLGAPVPTVTPWSNQSNSKDANKVKASEASRGAKELEKDADAVTAAKEAARDAARFIELNSRVDTGGLSDKNAVGRWTQGFGADYADMQSIAAKLTPAMRTPGSGTTSDADLALFKQATVGVDKPKKTNDNIANAYIARADQMEQYADFRQTYLEQNGTLSGAERHWKEYLNKNPIFDPAKKDSFELNASRKPWREHFKAGAGSATKEKTFNVNGTNMPAKQAADGKWYVKQANGKYAEVSE